MKNFFIVFLLLFLTSNSFGKDYSSLVERSPFGAPVQHISNVDEHDKCSAQFELHGIFMIHGEYLFSLYDVVSNKSVLKKVKEPGVNFIIKKYFPETQSIELSFPNGDFQVIKLKPIQFNNMPMPIKNPVQESTDKQKLGGNEVNDNVRREFSKIMNNKLN